MNIEKLPIDASLKQIIDKFEELSLHDFSNMGINIDVVAKTELPNEVKENQIVCITDTVVNNFIISVSKPVKINSNDIWIKNHTNDNFVGEEIEIKTSNKNNKFIIQRVLSIDK